MNKTKRLDELVNSVEALLAKLPRDLSPEIAQLRDRVDQSILDTWTSVARERAQARADVTYVTDSLERYARTNPWVIVGACAVLVGSLAFLAGEHTRPR